MDHFQQRSEEPTPRRLREAKEAGDVPFSEDLFKALFLLLALLMLWAFAKLSKHKFIALFQFSTLQCKDPVDALYEAFFPFLVPLATLMVSFFFLTFALYFLQRGFLFVFKKQKVPKKETIFVPALFYLLKTAALLVTALLFLRFATFSFAMLLYFAFTLLFVLLFLGILDFLFQRVHWKKRMKMTPQEVKDEQQENEGRR